MKLLSPQNPKDPRVDTRELLRAQEMKKETERIRQEFNDAEAKFRTMLANNREVWAQEEQEHLDLIKTRQAELAALDLQCQEMLKPVEFLKLELKTKLIDTDKLKADLEIKLDETDTLQDRLQDKLDELGVKQADLTTKTAQIEAKALGVEQQATQVKEGLKTLNLRSSELLAKTQAFETKYGKWQTDLKLFEANLLALGEVLKERAQDYTHWAQNIKDAELVVEIKRQEIFRPVEEIISEAKADRVKAQAELAIAQEDRIEAGRIKKQTELDYTTRLASLTERETELVKAELSVHQLKMDLLVKRKILENQEMDLELKSSHLEERQLSLSKDLQAFQNFKSVQDLEVKKTLQLVENKEIETEKKLETAVIERTKAENLLNDVKDRERSLRTTQFKLDEKQQKVIDLIQTQQQSKLEVNQALAELVIERETFAQWRTDAEKFVADRELKNSTDKKLLAKKDEKLRRQEKFLINLDKKLKDDQERLARNWQELRRKYPQTK